MRDCTTESGGAGPRRVVHEWDAVGGFESQIVRSVERAIRLCALTASDPVEAELQEWLFDSSDGRLMRAGEIVEMAADSGDAGSIEARLVARDPQSPVEGSEGAPPFVTDEGARLTERLRASSPGLEAVRRMRLQRSTRILVQEGREIAALHADRVQPTSVAGWNGSGQAASFFRIRLEANESDSLSMRLLIRLLDRMERLDRSASPGEIPIGPQRQSGADHPTRGRSAPVKLSASTATRDYVGSILVEQLAKVAGNVAGARSGEDPSHVHDIRVACQRMRTALRLFRRALPIEAATLRSEIAWLRDALGEVRDVDVQAEKLAAAMNEPDLDRSALGEIEARIAEEHARRSGGMREVLDSKRFEHLLADVGAFAGTGPNREAPRESRPVGLALPKLIAKLTREIERRVAALEADSSFEDVHRARIRLKSLRYLLEFVEPIYGKTVRRPIAAMRRIQDRLGEIQDEVVLVELLRGLASGAATCPPASAFVLGRLAERHSGRAARLKSRLHKLAVELKSAGLERVAKRSRSVRAKLS